MIGSLNQTITLLRRYLRPDSIFGNKISLLQSVLDGIKPILPIGVTAFQPARLVRVTLNKSIPALRNRRITELKYLKYPPAGAVRNYGRCNLPQQSILYGAFNWITANSENLPDWGDIVAVSEWELVSADTFLTTCPIFYITESRRNEAVHNPISLKFKNDYENWLHAHYPPEAHEQTDRMMELMAAIFAKVVNKSNHWDYYLSAYLSQIIFDHPNAGVEMIVYPSVAGDLGDSNMVIRPEVFDRKFRLIKVRELTLKSRNGGGSMYDNRATSRYIDHDYGIVVW